MQRLLGLPLPRGEQDLRERRRRGCRTRPRGLQVSRRFARVGGTGDLRRPLQVGRQPRPNLRRPANVVGPGRPPGRRRRYRLRAARRAAGRSKSPFCPGAGAASVVGTLSAAQAEGDQPSEPRCASGHGSTLADGNVAARLVTAWTRGGRYGRRVVYADLKADETVDATITLLKGAEGTRFETHPVPHGSVRDPAGSGHVGQARSRPAPGRSSRPGG